MYRYVLWEHRRVNEYMGKVEKAPLWGKNSSGNA